MSSPAHLSVETIINLAENGVKTDALLDMLKLSFTHRADRLTTWDGPDGLFKLWNSVVKEGNVISARLARQEAGSARAKGYVYEDATDDWEDDESDITDPNDPRRKELLQAMGERSVAWWEDPISGQPSSLEETCLVLLDSGFSPSSNPVLRAKLRQVAKKSIRSLVDKYRMAVSMSCSAFVIPGMSARASFLALIRKAL